MEENSDILQASTADRLWALESKLAIGELICRYCLAVDDRDVERLEDCYTADAVLTSTDGVRDARGRAAVIAHYRRSFDNLGPGMHFTHDRLVEFDPADPRRATGIILAHGEFVTGGKPLIAALRYHDRYRCEEGNWRIAERVMSFLYCLPPGEYIDRIGRPERVIAADGMAPAGWPEQLRSWRDYYGA